MKVLGLLAAVALIVGCGGDDQLSEEELVSQADEICAEADSNLEGIEQELQRASNPSELTDALGRLVEAGDSVLSDLEQLEPPEELADQYTQYLDNSEQAIDTAEELQTAVESENQGQTRELVSELQQLTEESQELASEIGFQECGSGS